MLLKKDVTRSTPHSTMHNLLCVCVCERERERGRERERERERDRAKFHGRVVQMSYNEMDSNINMYMYDFPIRR